ncbi:SDR family NAD(P)-dependent oxidoreductase [Herbaspirillum rhizosphaerae]|uniref:SDR family NAD(P)-dependent oxidoreductase n=1 Tax=Herbaspirillum rhizosphaerae TaxID=346179 RepID=UPI00067BB075|nr:SDR family oxidoreductase [Herbaspirillum rhizosphaerae]
MSATYQLASYPSLKGKRVFVTGGGTGIGAAIVSALAEQGAVVAFVDIARDASEALCKKIADAGFVAPSFRYCDLRDIASLQNTIKELAAQLGDFDVLVNNAANDERHKLEDVTQEYWDNRIAINQRPSFFAVQAIAPGMIKKKAGSIINFSSISWHTSSGGFPVYTTAKSSVLGLTRGLARDLGAHNIRVNTVTPGWVMTERQIELWLDEKGKEDIKRNQCLQGELLPWHLARMVLFLASDESVMCTAQEFIVDAGWA